MNWLAHWERWDELISVLVSHVCILLPSSHESSYIEGPTASDCASDPVIAEMKVHFDFSVWIHLDVCKYLEEPCEK